MKVILKTKWDFIDGSTKDQKKVKVGPGEFEVERIPNPYGLHNNWLVLKGTKTGLAEGFLRDWKNGKILDNPGHPDHGKPVEHGDDEIVIQE